MPHKRLATLALGKAEYVHPIRPATRQHHCSAQRCVQGAAELGSIRGTRARAVPVDSWHEARNVTLLKHMVSCKLDLVMKAVEEDQARVRSAIGH